MTTSHKTRFNNSKWEKIFKERKIIANIDRLESIKDNLSRKEEILHWFNLTETSDSFVILDDDKSFNGLPDSIKKRTIVTSGTIGLTIDNARKAIEILKKEELLLV